VNPMTSINDRLIAPHATRAEIALGYTVGIVGAAAAAGLGVGAHQSVLVVVVVAVVGFDIFGGAVVNATTSASRWFHRPGRTAWHHLGFVGVHIQPFFLAWLVPGVRWVDAFLVYVLALVAAVVVVRASSALRAPVAFAVTVFGIGVTTTLLTFPSFLAWFAPVLLVKLLLGHLLPASVATRG